MAEPAIVPGAFVPVFGKTPIATADVHIDDAPSCRIWRVQACGADGLAAALARWPALPREPCRVGGAWPRALWLAPDDWLLVEPGEVGGDVDGWRSPLGQPSELVISEAGSGMRVLRVSGPRARDLLAKGSTIDFHARAFAPGTCIRTRFAQLHVLVDAVEEGVFDLYVERNLAPWLLHGLEDALGDFEADDDPA